jgi:hypothetical protein
MTSCSLESRATPILAEGEREGYASSTSLGLATNLNASSGTLTNNDHSVGVSGEFETRRVARHTLGASFFIKDDTHVEQATTFSRTNVASTTPSQTDRDRQSSFGIQDIMTVSSRIRATAGFSADQLNGLEHKT